MENNKGGFTSLLFVVPRGTNKRSWDIEDNGPRVGYLLGIKSRVDSKDPRKTGRTFRMYSHTVVTQHLFSLVTIFR
jgi:hypothetical protein